MSISRLGSTLLAGALFALATIVAVRAENIHLLLFTTPFLGAIALRRLSLNWTSLARSILISMCILAIEYKQGAIILGLVQMLGVGLLALVDPAVVKKEKELKIPGNKIIVTGLAIPVIGLTLVGKWDPETIQMALISSGYVSGFLALLSLVLALLKESRPAAVVGATGAFMFYVAYLTVLLILNFN